MVLIKKNKEYLYAILVILVVEITQIPQFKMFVQSDDFGYIADSAFFAGYNWKTYTGDITPYYPFGFSWPAALLFRSSSDPIHLYRALLVYITLLIVVLFLVVALICSDILKLEAKASSFIALTTAIGALGPQSGLYYMAEVPFAILLFISFYFLVKSVNVKDTWKSMMYAAMCGLSVAYTYTVHSRFLMLLFTVAVLSAVVLFCDEKNIKIVGCGFMSFIIFFLVFRAIAKIIQNELYVKSVTATDVGGTSGQRDIFTMLTWIPDILSNYCSLAGWSRFFHEFFSLHGSMTFLSGGMIWLAIFGCIHLLISAKKNKIPITDGTILLCIASIVSYFGMHLLISILGANNMKGTPTQIRWLTFYRYLRPFSGLLYLSGISYLYKEKKVLQKHINCKMIITIGMLLAIYMSEFPAYVYQNSDHEEVSPVGWFGYYFYYGEAPVVYFKKMAMISILLVMIFVYMFYKGKQKYAFIIYLAFSVALSFSENKWNVNNNSERNFAMIDGTFDLFQHTDFGDNIQIYYGLDSYGGRLRYILYDKNMIFLNDNELFKNIDFGDSILLTQQASVINRYGVDAYCYELDDLEYLYTKNENVIRLVEEWQFARNVGTKTH